MSDETIRLLWDDLYEGLVGGQNTAMRVLGDEKALPLYRALADAMRIAQDLAPPGWRVEDRFGYLARRAGSQ